MEMQNVANKTFQFTRTAFLEVIYLAPGTSDMLWLACF